VRSNHAHVKSIDIVPRRDGYCTAQEYLLAAWDGDVRLFVMNGHRLMAGKRRRVNRNGHMRYTPAASGVTFHVEHIVHARRTRHGDGECVLAVRFARRSDMPPPVSDLSNRATQPNVNLLQSPLGFFQPRNHDIVYESGPAISMTPSPAMRSAHDLDYPSADKRE
jgi:hypothetical protein